jgi:hypothetical protein
VRKRVERQWEIGVEQDAIYRGFHDMALNDCVGAVELGSPRKS